MINSSPIPQILPLTFNLLLLLAGAGISLQAADPTAYVSSYFQDVITTVDPTTGATKKLANAGINGTSFVVSPDGSKAYVVASTEALGFSVGIGVVNLASGAYAGPLTAAPVTSLTDLALSADGSLLYYISGNSLAVVDTSSNNLVTTAPAGAICPCLFALAPAADEIFIATPYGLIALNSQTYAPIALSYTSEAPISGLALSPDGTKIYVVTANSKTMVSVLNTSGGAVIATIPYTDEGLVSGAAASPDGQSLYITSEKGLVRVSTATYTVVGEVRTPPLTNQVQVSEDSHYVFVNRQFTTVPGLLRFDVSAESFSSVSIGGTAIAQQIPSASGPMYVLQSAYGIAAEDTVTMATEPVGAAVGTFSLTSSSSGNLVAGLSEVATSASSEAFVTLVDTNANTVSGQFAFSFPVGGPPIPLSLAISGDGTQGYAAYGTSALQAEVEVLALPKGTPTKSFTINSPYASVAPDFISVSPDGSTLFSLLTAYSNAAGYAFEVLCGTNLSTYVTTGCADLALDSGQFQVTGTSFAQTPDGTEVYIPTYQGISNIEHDTALFLLEVGTAKMNVSRALEIPGPGPSTGLPETQIVYSAATDSVYLSNQDFEALKGGSIMRIDLSTYTVAATQYLAYNPSGLAITPDGTKLFVTGSLTGTQIFDGTTLSPVGSIPGGLQQAIVIAPQ